MKAEILKTAFLNITSAGIIPDTNKLTFEVNKLWKELVMMSEEDKIVCKKCGIKPSIIDVGGGQKRLSCSCTTVQGSDMAEMIKEWKSK